MPTSSPEPTSVKWKNAWVQNMIETLVVSFQSKETREWFQVFLVDPVVSYIMERCLPYFIIGIVIVIAIFFFVISTFYLVFRGRNVGCPHCA